MTAPTAAPTMNGIRFGRLRNVRLRICWRSSRLIWPPSAAFTDAGLVRSMPRSSVHAVRYARLRSLALPGGRRPYTSWSSATSFSSIAATPVISVASSTISAGGTGSMAAAPMPAPTVEVAFAAPAISLSASSSGPRPGNCARRVARSRTGMRGALSMTRSAMYRAAALAFSPPLRTPFLTACSRWIRARSRAPSSASAAGGTAAAVPDATAGTPGAAGPVSGPVAPACVSAGSPDFRKRFRNGVEPVTADASQSQSRQIG